MTLRPGLTVGAVTVLLALAGCGQTEDPPEAAAEPTAEAESEGAAVAPGEGPEWGYEGEVGPAHWAALDPAFAECGTGQQQSPIDLVRDLATPDPAAVPPVTYEYQPASYEVADIGHTIQASTGSGGGVSIGGEFYELLQAHVHAPSEHALDGQRTDLSVHLVHQNAAGELAVVGLFVEPGEATSGVDTLFAELPAEDQPVSVADVDASTLLPDDRTVYRYDGSLTTPPCTEGVQWLVLPDVVTASPAVVDTLAEAVEGTARPLQPVNDRDVVLVEDAPAPR